MTDDVRRQVRQNLELRETDELLEIWRRNDRASWTDLAFEEIRQILVMRLGEIPPQPEPTEAPVPASRADADDLLGWEARAVDADDQPEFYDVLEVIQINRRIHTLIIAVIIVNVMVGVLSFPQMDTTVAGYFQPGTQVPLVAHIVAVIVTMLVTIVYVLIVRAGLTALATILRILMEMEFNSRKAP